MIHLDSAPCRHVQSCQLTVSSGATSSGKMKPTTCFACHLSWHVTASTSGDRISIKSVKPLALEALKEKGQVVILAGMWFLQGPYSPVQRLATRHSHSYFEKYWTLISSILPCNNPLIMPGSWNSRGLHWLFLEHLQVFPHYCLLCGWMIIEVSLTKATRFLWSGCPSPSSNLAQTGPRKMSVLTHTWKVYRKHVSGMAGSRVTLFQDTISFFLGSAFLQVDSVA